MGWPHFFCMWFPQCGRRPSTSEKPYSSASAQVEKTRPDFSKSFGSATRFTTARPEYTGVSDSAKSGSFATASRQLTSVTPRCSRRSDGRGLVGISRQSLLRPGENHVHSDGLRFCPGTPTQECGRRRLYTRVPALRSNARTPRRYRGQLVRGSREGSGFCRIRDPRVFRTGGSEPCSGPEALRKIRARFLYLGTR